MPTSATALKPGASAGLAVLSAHNLTTAQMNVLRPAARKWRNYRDDTQGLHDGQIEQVGVRGATLQILVNRGLLVKEFFLSEVERAEQNRQANEKARKAFIVAKVHDHDDEMQTDGIQEGSVIAVPAWQVVLDLLQEVSEVKHTNTRKVIRITDAGRKIVAEFKAAVGATEE